MWNKKISCSKSRYLYGSQGFIFIYYILKKKCCCKSVTNLSFSKVLLTIVTIRVNSHPNILWPAMSVCIFICFFLHEIELKQGIQLGGGEFISFFIIRCKIIERDTGEIHEGRGHIKLLKLDRGCWRILATLSQCSISRVGSRPVKT